MSYDVELMGDYCAHCKRGESVYRWNYTSNLSGAWREAGYPGAALARGGLDARVPASIAAASARGVPVCSGACRWAR